MNLWQPSASIAVLKRRSELLAQTREFLDNAGYYEVETPILSADIVVDAQIEPFETKFIHDGNADLCHSRRLFLQTSPEFAMKRLLAAGSGSIYQFTRAFRNGDVGRLHNPEFTIAEWYRVGGNYLELAKEVSDLLCELIGTAAAEPITYRDAFLRHADIDPFESDTDLLVDIAQLNGFGVKDGSRDDMLNFLLGTVVAPQLGEQRPVILYDYPASQAALAKVNAEAPPAAQRFEIFYRGIELCNGYQELTDVDELMERNRQQNVVRRQCGRNELPVESHLLAAMRTGLPECAGVALGFDRTVMFATDSELLGNVMSFEFERA